MVGTFSITTKLAPLPKACDTTLFAAAVFPQNEQTNDTPCFTSRLLLRIVFDSVNRDGHSVIVASQFRYHVQPGLFKYLPGNFIGALSFNEIFVFLPNVVKLAFNDLAIQNTMNDVGRKEIVIIHSAACVIGDAQLAPSNAVPHFEQNGVVQIGLIKSSRAPVWRPLRSQRNAIAPNR